MSVTLLSISSHLQTKHTCNTSYPTTSLFQQNNFLQDKSYFFSTISMYFLENCHTTFPNHTESLFTAERVVLYRPTQSARSEAHFRSCRVRARMQQEKKGIAPTRTISYLPRARAQQLCITPQQRTLNYTGPTPTLS
jgi:hypothetical protein